MNIQNCIKTGIVFTICCIIITLIRCSTEKTPSLDKQGDIQYSFKWDKRLKGYPARNGLDTVSIRQTEVQSSRWKMMPMN